jgi:hypothetical protein
MPATVRAIDVAGQGFERHSKKKLLRASLNGFLQANLSLQFAGVKAE